MVSLALSPSVPSWRRAGIIAALGLIGVASLLASTVVPADLATEAGIAYDALRLLVLVQPSILVIAAAIAGDRLTRTTHLSAPFISGSRQVPVRAAVLAALAGALVVGSVLATYNWITTEVAPVTLVPGTSLSLITGVLYGGLTEEVLIRWGLMGLIVWAMMKLRRRTNDQGPTTPIIAVAIAITSITFAALHFPALFALTDPSITIIGTSFAANVLAGVVFGALFAARGLESAMGAHAGAHVIGLGLTSLLLG